MTYLLADIGGTNARLALADAGGVDANSIRRFRNGEFPDFDRLLSQYLDQLGRPAVEQVCCAIAGPVAGTSAQLTNRNWHFSSDRIAIESGAKKIHLINDLSALAQALPRIATERLCGPMPHAGAGQSLVIGMGTGFNVSPVKTHANGEISVFAAEMGHASLPMPVLTVLEAGLSDARTQFQTAEDCFSGPGLEHMFTALTGHSMAGSEIMRRFADGSDQQAQKVVTLFSRALGVFTSELIYHFMPRAGIFFAGSVSVSLLDSAARQAFLASFQAPARLHATSQTIPVSLIRDDTAALWGCLDHIRFGLTK